MKNKVFLVGYMGVGKTTIGKKIAKLLKFRYIDLDAEIEVAMGVPVAAIFQNFGESVFRKKEASLLQQNDDEEYVIATGGGAPLFHDNMSYMLKSGVVVYLKMSPGMLFQRLRQSKKERPLIAGIADSRLETYIEDHLKARQPVYEKAHIQWEAKKNSAADLQKLSGQIKKALGDASHST